MAAPYPPAPVAPAVPDVTSDPLFGALKKYITTGPGARNVSVGALTKLFSETTAEPGGRAYLDNLTGVGVGAGVGEYREWNADPVPIGGFIDISKLELKLVNLNASDIGRTINGRIRGGFVPHVGPIQGELHYDNLEHLQPGSQIQFKIDYQYHSASLHIHFYSNKEWIADFVVSPIGFPAPYSPYQGSATVE